MEQVVAVDQAVFGARPLDDVLRLILQGGAAHGSYPQGCCSRASRRACAWRWPRARRPPPSSAAP